MKKRNVISIIITIICIILTNKFWFNIKPLQIAFNAIGTGNTKFEFFLNKKDNNDFKKVKYGVVEANLDDTENIELFINRVHKAKKVKITITSPNQKNLILSKISLRYDKYKLDDLDAFSAENATLKIDENKLIITPKAKSFSIIYNKPVNIKSATKIDIKILIVIAVLTFLLSYKLTSYLADFKIINNASRLDIIFLLIFFVLLFIPMSNINKAKISVKENRTLTQLSGIIDDGKINFNFGNNFNDWYNDRFFLRKFILKSYFDIRYAIAQNYYNSQGLIDKKNKILYIYSDKIKPISLSTLDINFQELNKFNTFCKENGIKLYILIVTPKETIEVPQYINTTNATVVYKGIENKISLIKRKYALNVIYPYTAIKEQKDGHYMFFKTEHHWTDDGAFIGYNSLLKEIKKDYPKVKILDKNDFNYFYNKQVRGDFSREFTEGLTCNYVGLSNKKCKKYLDTKYRYYRHKDFKNLSVKIDNDPYKLVKDYYYPNGVNLRAILLGTSMSENLCEFIPFTFKHVKRIRNINVPNIKTSDEFKIMKYYKKDILNYKPDILILCITYENIYKLNQLFKD